MAQGPVNHTRAGMSRVYMVRLSRKIIELQFYLLKLLKPFKHTRNSRDKQAVEMINGLMSKCWITARTYGSIS